MIHWPITVIQNKYTRCYERIVVRAQLRTLPVDTYVEKHHIIPRSIGGNNSKSNLAILTAREHFICHWLLIKMLTPGIERSKMFRALSFMRAKTKDQHRYTSPITSRVYEKIKPEISKHQTILMTGRIPSESHRKKMSESMTGRKQTEEHRKNSSLARIGKPGHAWTDEQREKFLKRVADQGGSMLGKSHSIEARQKMSKAQKDRITDEERSIRSKRSSGENNPMYGRKQTDEAKKKMSRLGWKHSEETKAKMREARAGQNTGRKLSEETKKKISEARLAKIAAGELTPWNKGKTSKKD
jgi:hypothetical protein